MKLTGNTIFITGGGSGIGLGLAEAFHKLGNKVIISGRRRDRLQAVIDANPGMAAIDLDIMDPTSIKTAAKTLMAEHPAFNVLINNAGITLIDDIRGEIDEELLVATVGTNLMGPIRMSAALVDHLKRQDDAVIANVSSALAFVPMAVTAVYCATKAAIHSYTLSQRYRLRESGITVLEIAPPWVRTALLNSSEEQRAMPLDQFISETMAILATDAEEILVGPAPHMRANPGPGEHAWVTEFNDILMSGPAIG